MKDGTKTISERATRFLPVNMKDRLKSAFNRNSANATPANAPAEDATDYNAVFNANRSPATPDNPRFNGPNGPVVGRNIELTKLAGPPSSLTTRNPAPEIAPDIEDAEIVVEPSDDPAASPEWQAASLKTRKHAGPAVEAKGEEGQPVFKYENSKDEEAVAQKPKPRFFGDFASTESVRLKVEKRNETRPATVPLSSNGDQRTRPEQPELRPLEVRARGAEDRMAAGFVYEAQPLEHDAYRAPTEEVALRPATSDQANINLPKENDSMDANGQESENGAAVRTDGSGSGAAITIERNSKFSGQLKFSGAVAIDGQVEGELIAERIVVHEGGVVNANVEGNTVVIAGTVKGDIYAHGELEILPSGVVLGSVTAPAISVRRGGRVEGRCAIGVPRQ